MTKRRLAGPPLALMLALMMAVRLHAADKDPDTGLIMAEGWEVVRTHCTACHSASLVTQNSGSRNHWLGLIRWMQESQNLWQFDAATENTILDYLSTHYGTKEGTRRAPLPRSMMPENPYKAPSGEGAGEGS